MNEDERKAAYAAWLAARPPQVQGLAAEFPMGSRFEVDGEGITHYLVGWTEGDELILSTTDPAVDYAHAMATKVYVCADHYRVKKQRA